MANKSPAFQFYPKQFLGDDNVILMDAEEVGMYWLLCCVAWQQTPPCSLPDDDEKLAKWARVSHDTFVQKSVTLKACFKKKRGRLVQEGLLREWNKQKERAGKASNAAKIRWDNERNADAMRTHSDGNALHTTSSTTSSKVIQAVERLRKDHPVYRKTTDEYLNGLIADFPTIDHAKVLNKLHAFEIDGGNTKKPSLRIRNWFENEKKYQGNSQHKGGVSNDLTHLGEGVPD